MKISIILIIMSAALVLSAVTQDFELKDHSIILEFDNIHIKDIDFINSKKMVVEHSKRDNVTIFKENNKFIFKSNNSAKIEIGLPKGITYVFIKDGAKLEFNESRISIAESSNKFVEYRVGKIIINDDGDKVEIGADGINVINNEDYVEISSRGLIVETEGESKHITGFWGQLLGGTVNFITKLSIGWLGNNPGVVIKHLVNDDGNENGFNVNITNDDKFSRTFRDAFIPKPGAEINIDNYNGNVEVKSWDSDTIDIVAVLSSRNSESELDNVKIEILDDKGYTIKTNLLKNDTRITVNYLIQIPSQVSVSNVKTSNGRIFVSGCHGDMHLNTSNGRIRITNSQGSFSANSSNGKIEFYDLMGKAEANTSNGSIRIKNTPGIKQAETSNAKITLSLSEKLTDNILLSTSNGTINIGVDPLLEFTINCETSNAGIDVKGIDVIASQSSPERLFGKVNSGVYKISAITSNGRIIIYKLEK
ncbi:MAG: DUF4097 domain-containing protein [Candidatus Cloacimonetes bacterium]|nr:DUF4097 domain-containing protein [Candidatus Cloacimonadota bacterium]